MSDCRAANCQVLGWVPSGHRVGTAEPTMPWLIHSIGAPGQMAEVPQKARPVPGAPYSFVETTEGDC